VKNQTHLSTNTYTVVDLVGEGSNSLVYKAIKSDSQKQIQTVIALKILKSETVMESWRAEFESLRRVRSLHCVSVHNFEWVMDRPALCLEYVEGVNLYDLVGATDLTADQVFEIAAQALAGLKDLWRQNLLHGDLSPANILVSANGVVKLLDFGLANRQESSRRATPQFVAPEAVLGGAESETSDLYSLGKVLEFLAPKSVQTPPLATAIVQLTQINAEKRQAPDQVSHEFLREQLAQLVQKILEDRKLQSNKTKEFTVQSVSFPFAAATPKKRKVVMSRRWAWSGLALLAIALILTAFWWSRSPQTATLMVRSQHWYRIWINDVDYGYTPLEVPNLQAGPVIIRWQGESGSGQRALTLRRGENRVINDIFFQTQE
jgi:serine/threonine protein kinase